MRRTAPGLVALVVLALAALLPGCAGATQLCKWVGLCRPPTLELPPAVPQDFQLIVHVTDQADPPADYLLTIRRSGQCNYRVTVRSPRRRETSGPFQILEDQVGALYQALRDGRYAELDARYPSSGEGADRALGIQAYSVTANDLSKEVQAHFQAVPALERVRTLALSYLPPQLLTDTGPGAVTSKTREVIGDAKSKVFYPVEDKRLEDVPADRRQPFPTWYDAVNAGYSPVQGFEPWKRE